MTVWRVRWCCHGLLIEWRWSLIGIILHAIHRWVCLRLSWIGGDAVGWKRRIVHCWLIVRRLNWNKTNRITDRLESIAAVLRHLPDLHEESFLILFETVDKIVALSFPRRDSSNTFHCHCCTAAAAVGEGDDDDQWFFVDVEQPFVWGFEQRRLSVDFRSAWHVDCNGWYLNRVEENCDVLLAVDQQRSTMRWAKSERTRFVVGSDDFVRETKRECHPMTKGRGNLRFSVWYHWETHRIDLDQLEWCLGRHVENQLRWANRDWRFSSMVLPWIWYWSLSSLLYHSYWPIVEYWILE